MELKSYQKKVIADLTRYLELLNETKSDAAAFRLFWQAKSCLLYTSLGAGLAVWGVVNLMEGYGNDNPGAKSQGIKQLMAGGGVVLIGTTLIPLLSGLF